MLAATQIKMCGFISLSQTASVHFTLETTVGFGDGDSERCTVCDTFLCVKSKQGGWWSTVKTTGISFQRKCGFNLMLIKQTWHLRADYCAQDLSAGGKGKMKEGRGTGGKGNGNETKEDLQHLLACIMSVHVPLGKHFLTFGPTITRLPLQMYSIS